MGCLLKKKPEIEVVREEDIERLLSTQSDKVEGTPRYVYTVCITHSHTRQNARLSCGFARQRKLFQNKYFTCYFTGLVGPLDGDSEYVARSREFDSQPE